MKTSSLTFTLLLIYSIQAKAQDFKTAQPFRFYTSYEDFISNKPMEGYSIFRKRINSKAVEVLDYDHLWVNVNGEDKHLKPKEYPSSLFTDEDGLLVRYFDKNAYQVIIVGKYCLYVWPYNNPIANLGDGKFEIVGSSGYISNGKYSGSSFPAQFWSEGFDGPINEIKDKDLKPILEEKDLLKKFERKKVKRELKMSAIEYGYKEYKVYCEFINLLNL